MPRGKKHTPEQIICKLREAEVTNSEGQTAALAVKAIGVTYQTYCPWRKEYGGLRTWAINSRRDGMRVSQRSRSTSFPLPVITAISENAQCTSKAI